VGKGILWLVLLVWGCAGPESGGGAKAEPDGSESEPTETGSPDTDTATDTGGGQPFDPCALDVVGNAALLEAPILSAAELSSAASPASPIGEDAFAMPADAPAAHHIFEGRLQLHDEAEAQMETHFADYWISPGQATSTLPEIDLQLVQCGRDVIPAQRGRIITDDPYWDLLVSPGKAWSTGFDDGMSRAALPFSLTFKFENCTQNGVLTFLFDSDQVSQVRYQVTQETCPWHIFDLWGQSSASYIPGPVEGAETIRTDFLEELDNRFPVKPLADLEADYPGFSLSALDEGLTLEEQTSRGILVDGTLYLADCPTRFGNHAFCETITLPSYSLSKTLYVGLTMAALAQELEVDPYAQEVSDLLPAATAASPGQWEGVTLEHLIDMSTGHYRYAQQTDDFLGDFFYDYTLDGRLEASFLFPYQEPPGQRMVYLTPHFQIAAAAMDALLLSQGEEITDSFGWAVERIYKPAGLPPELFSSLRTWEDGGQNNGTAFGGYGMILTPQGIAQLSRFVLDGGAVDGKQILHPDRLAETLFQDPEDVGAPMNYYDWSYNNGMWGYPLAPWGCEGKVPTLFGVSGVTVMLAPNGVVYFAFNDMVEQPVVSILNQLDAISPLCP